MAIAERADLATGEISNRTEWVYRILEELL
jgi:hypothetical protein